LAAAKAFAILADPFRFVCVSGVYFLEASTLVVGFYGLTQEGEEVLGEGRTILNIGIRGLAGI
jgi:hypothetical protein